MPLSDLTERTIQVVEELGAKFNASAWAERFIFNYCFCCVTWHCISNTLEICFVNELDRSTLQYHFRLFVYCLSVDMPII